MQARLNAECGGIDGAYQVGGGLDAPRRWGDGIDPVAGMVLDYGVVGFVVKAMVALVAGDKEVDCVAWRLNLIDGHFLYIDGMGCECGSHKE